MMFLKMTKLLISKAVIMMMSGEMNLFNYLEINYANVDKYYII